MHACMHAARTRTCYAMVDTNLLLFVVGLQAMKLLAKVFKNTGSTVDLHVLVDLPY